MRNLRIASRTLLALCSALALTRSAEAQTSSEQLAAAETAFNDALRLMDRGEFAAACPKLEQSQKLAPASGTLLNLADCYEQLGRPASAWTRFSKAAEFARRTGKPERERVARQRAEALRARVVLVTVTVLSTPSAGLQIALDGVTIPSDELGLPFAVDPGTHVVDASAPGREPFRATLANPPAGSSLPVQIPELQPLAPKAAAVPEATHSSSRFDAQGVAALVSAGVGLTGVVAGVAFGLHSKSKHDESDRYCNGNVCDDARGVTAMQDARVAGDRATVSFVVGGLGLGAATVLWFARPFGRHERGAVRVGVTPSALQVTGTW